MSFQPTLEIKQTEQVVIGGVKGTGKSNLGKIITKFLIDSGCPVKLVDPLDEHKSFTDKCEILPFRIGQSKEFDKYLGTLWGKWKGMLVVDEADSIFPNIPNTRLNFNSNYLCHYGRHYGIGLMCLTRRLSRLHADIVSQTSKLFMFKLFSSADFSYLKDCQLDEIVKLIPQLGDYEFIVLDTSKLNEERMFIHEPVPLYE